jgi:large subunit ribosomal protein L10
VDNPRAEKVAVATEVRERLAAADAAILTEYRGLKVKDLAQLRRDLAPVGGDYRVYKNTLARFAVREVGHEELVPMLEGPTAITFVSGDPAAVAKVLKDFSGTNPLLVIKGGVLGDKVIGASETSALASMPSREVLLGRLAGGIAAPLTQMAGLLQALPRSFAYGLKALIDQKSDDGGSAPDTDAA